MTSFTTPAATWTGMPTELKLAVVDHLSKPDLISFGLTSRDNHALSIPNLYRDVRLASVDDLQVFLDSAPSPRLPCVRRLSVSTKPSTPCSGREEAILGPWDIPEDHEVRATDLVHDLLMQCSNVQRLDLDLCGTLLPKVVPSFEQLSNLHTLNINNVASEEHLPVSERLVVAMASAAPKLTALSIAGIARSLVHAPELVGAYPLVPVSDDGMDEFLPSPVSPDLCLPELLALPRLRSLSIRDTHLGDAKWKNAPVSSSLDSLTLGAPCAFELPEALKEHAEALLANPALAACKTICDPTLGVPEMAAATKSEAPKEEVPVVSTLAPPQAPTPPTASPRSTRFPSLTALVIDLPHATTSDASDADTPGLSTTSSSSSATESPGPLSPPSLPALEIRVDYPFEGEDVGTSASAHEPAKSGANSLAVRAAVSRDNSFA